MRSATASIPKHTERLAAYWAEVLSGPTTYSTPGARRALCDGAPPLVVVSLSTSYQGQERALRAIVEALGRLTVRAVVSTGRSVEIGEPVPDNMRVADWVDHAALLPEASLMVTHAGMGTVMTTLAHGVPMLCMPMGRDQHGNAERVERLRCGVTVGMDASSSEIAEMLSTALGDAELRSRAAECASQLRLDIDRDLAVTEIEATAQAPTGVTVHQGGH